MAAGGSDLEVHGWLGMRVDIPALCARERPEALMACQTQHSAPAHLAIAPDILGDHRRDQPRPLAVYSQTGGP